MNASAAGRGTKPSGFLYGVVALCTAISLFDGYDGSAAAFTGPSLLSEYHFRPDVLGLIFSASLVGMVIGSAALGLIADRIGRRPAVILSIVVFGVFTLLTGLANSFDGLMIYRLLTGLGLGGALSNSVALSAEFAPRRYRATVVSIVYSAFPMGAVLGGYLAVWLLKDFGWRSVFLVSAGATVPLFAVVLVYFPESLKFLVAKNAPQARIQALLDRVGPASAVLLDAEQEEAPAAPFKALFIKGMWWRTSLLWATFFINQMVVYFLFLWMPVALKTFRLGAQTGIIASATQSLGGVVGALILARIIDKRGPPILTAAYIAALMLVAAVGVAASHSALALITTMGCCGFMLNGANVNLAAVGASLYPTSARSTGLGWAMSIGKSGGIVGSMVGGVLLETHLGLPALYALAGTPLILAAAAMWALARSGSVARPNAEMTAAAILNE